MKALITTALLCASASVSAQVLVRASPDMGLSVSMKTANPQPTVEFVVTQPNGKKSVATAQPVNGGERSGEVHYPYDFSDAGKHIGVYIWTASVAGKEVARGKFEFRASDNGTLLFSPN